MRRLRLFRPLLGIVIVALVVLMTSALVKTVKHSSAEQTLDTPVKKSGLELFGDDGEEQLRIVDFKSLSPDRMLVSVNDTMYLLNAKKEVIWKTKIDMVAPPIVDSTGAIFGIRSDLGQFSVNAKTGEVSYFGRGVGGSHSHYTQIKPYTGNQYLIVENTQFYRDGNLCYPKCPMRSDALYAWSGQRLLWSTDFPPNAELQVWGNKILAVTKQKNSVVVQEVALPRK
jgi:hypothetical protein